MIKNEILTISWEIDRNEFWIWGKLSLKDEPLFLRETVDVRARGASKSFDTMELALFLSIKLNLKTSIFIIVLL